jgi:chromosome segregation ATPase
MENGRHGHLGGFMSKVYEVLKEVVQDTLQLNKVNSNPLARVKGANALTVIDEMEELEGIVAERIAKLKAAVTEGEAVVAGEAQHAAQVIGSLWAKITSLEDKLTETEETVRKNELASQRMDESITRRMQDLQIEIKKKEKSLESRGNEVKDLKSNIDALGKQVTQLQQAIQQAKDAAASEAKRVENLTETHKTKVAELEAQLRETEATVRGKDSTMQELAQSLAAKTQDFESQLRNKEKLLADRDKQVNDFNAQVQALTKGIKDMSSFFRKAEALAAIETQDIGTVLQASQLKNEQEKAAMSQNNTPKITSNKTDTPQEAVPPDFFDRVTYELTQAIGPMASMILRDHVKAMGESVEKFPKARVAELLKIVSEEIPDKNVKNRFHERLG